MPIDEIFARLYKGTGTKTQTELAQALGVRQATVSEVKKRGEVPSDWYIRLMESHGLNPAWLKNGEGPRRITEVAPDQGPLEIEKKTGSGKDTAAELDDYDLIPLAEAHLSAGGGAFVISEQAKKHLAFRKDWIRSVASGPSNLVLMNVRGDSMEPVISDGDVVMIDTGRTRIQDGGIYALGMGETISIKRLQVLVGDKLRIISDNRVEYPPYEVPAEEVRTLGRVIWYARELIKTNSH